MNDTNKAIKDLVDALEAGMFGASPGAMARTRLKRFLNELGIKSAHNPMYEGYAGLAAALNQLNSNSGQTQPIATGGAPSRSGKKK